MKWMITEDLINTEGPNHLNYRHGPSSCMFRFREVSRIKGLAGALFNFKEDMTDEFELYDDDGVLYYRGLCRDLDKQDASSAFQPLDWAANDVGATYMMYRKIGGTEWKQL